MGLTHFRQFISVEVKNISRKSQAQVWEKLWKLRLRQNYGFLIKNRVVSCIVFLVFLFCFLNSWFELKTLNMKLLVWRGRQNQRLWFWLPPFHHFFFNCFSCLIRDLWYLIGVWYLIDKPLNILSFLVLP